MAFEVRVRRLFTITLIWKHRDNGPSLSHAESLDSNTVTPPQLSEMSAVHSRTASMWYRHPKRLKQHIRYCVVKRF